MIAQQYLASPVAYLARARERLLADAPEQLFYAALELRCFVEARQDEYLKAQRRYARSVPKAWKTAEQGKALEGIFDPNRIQQLRYSFAQGEELDLFYMPVTPGLRNGAERLSNLIHAQGETRYPDSSWWVETRKKIVQVYRLAWFCSQGNLVSPALLRKGGTTGDVTALFSPAVADRLIPFLKGGKYFQLTVDYPQMPPQTWKCDL